ncbi:Inositol hexakisphosphate and diphosphoinositol-pentakisphosphate kinase [Choanephora cucurbitarum]|uniref:Inositol hexakisphosphate and diphosphoinositol-pentakisphosphate kinase n=1 Tax=Choanephora cucurbitarum TaxID=101091 RepID=A0A1C7NH80_9FUNG|nr:Inositol hexakisphosphate and diphosphoinositol-pentakisphosphate kinase [Choanephora cucurbitarum]
MPVADSPSIPEHISGRAKYVVGVCAMDRKARSKPMRHILNRLLSHGNFEIVIFGDKTILDEDVENWPGCDFLICFFSGGFPMHKAIAYTNLRKPFVVNNVHMQTLLWDRRVVLSILDAIGVPTPPRLVVSRDGGAKVDTEAAAVFKECTGMDMDRVLARYASNSKSVIIRDDGIEVDGQFLPKTFIEKPVDGEDHNINIYYSDEKGGGGRRLFRKIGNKSSEYDPELTTPNAEGSWIYEQLMQTESFEDIKLYTVGPQFVHAETRKSPTVDGHVKRNTDGKEIRYCAKLTQEEEDIARKVSKAFGQTVCGLDILRVKGKSYVIDVNGWSFVKGNDHYYEQCARILKEAFYRSVQERPLSLADQIPPEISPQNSWRLKGFVAVFRHGDRTPKEKLKITIMQQPFIDLLEGSKREVVFRQTHQLQSVMRAVEICLEKSSTEEDQEKLMSLKEVLEKKHDLPGTKIQLKPKYDKETQMLSKLQVIVKWGGEFTHAGRHQSKDLAENLRKDMFILNEKVLEDVKIYSSSERRVRDTAQVFGRWFLGDPETLEGVISESKYLLDDSNAAKDQADLVKRQLKNLLRPGNDIPEWMLAQMGWSAKLPQPHIILQEICTIMSRMQRVMRDNWSSKDIDNLQRRWCCFDSPILFRERWEKMFRHFACISHGDETDESSVRPYQAEKSVDPSWISVLYDSLKYDSIHNRQFLLAIFTDESSASLNQDIPESSAQNGLPMTDPTVDGCDTDVRRLYRAVKIMFDFIAPQEYGISDTEKKNIGMLISFPLLKKILSDLDEMTSSENARTRLYFTKESHVHALLNLIYLSGVPTKVPRNTLPELDYLTQITFELYERNRQSVPEKEYSLRIGFSSGAHYDSVLDLRLDAEHCLKVAPRRNLIPHLLVEEVLTYHKGYLNVPNLKSIEEQIEERKLYYAQEDND